MTLALDIEYKIGVEHWTPHNADIRSTTSYRCSHWLRFLFDCVFSLLLKIWDLSNTYWIRGANTTSNTRALPFEKQWKHKDSSHSISMQRSFVWWWSRVWISFKFTVRDVIVFWISVIDKQCVDCSKHTFEPHLHASIKKKKSKFQTKFQCFQIDSWFGFNQKRIRQIPVSNSLRQHFKRSFGDIYFIACTQFLLTLWTELTSLNTQKLISI